MTLTGSTANDTTLRGALAMAPTQLGEPLSLPAPSDELGIVAGRYALLSILGAGGMGAVYRARDLELDEVVALKRLRREFADNPSLVERFRQEVKLARRITHPSVARTFDIGEDAGTRFLTMELVEGESLACRLEREPGLSIAEAVGIAREVCQALGAAHAAGVVHRDLKPDNVLLADDGRVVLTDFGLAVALRETGGLASSARAGTPAYMAPEQLEGSRNLAGRADLYALGVLLYEMLTGARPWERDSECSSARRMTSPPPDPRVVRPEVPAALARVVLRCMARAPEGRYATASDVARALTGALARTRLASFTRTRPQPLTEGAPPSLRSRSTVRDAKRASRASRSSTPRRALHFGRGA